MTAARTNRTGVMKLWLLNLVANAAALAAWYYWLLIPDAHGWQVAASLLLAIVIGVLIVWLRAGTLAYFRVSQLRNQPEILPAFRRGLRHIIPLAIWAGIGAATIWLILSAGNYTPQFAVWIRQKANAGPAPRNVLSATDWLLFGLLWVILPAIWVPIATTIAATGLNLQRIGQSLRVLRRPLYWLWLCLILAFGIYIPYKLVTWVPELDSLAKQAWSMGLRFTLAYLIGVTAFILLVWMAGVYTDREAPIEE